MRVSKEYNQTPDISSWAHKANKEETKMFESKTGAKRSERVIRYDLIPKVFWDRVASKFTGEFTSINIESLGYGDIDRSKATGGALKYGECNWERGLITSDTINHIYDHLNTYTNYFREQLKYSEGDMSQVVNAMQSLSRNEDHLAGAAFGLVVLMHQESEGKMFHDDSFKKPEGFTNTQEQSVEQGTNYSDEFVKRLERYSLQLEEENKILNKNLEEIRNEHSRKSKRNSRKLRSNKR